MNEACMSFFHFLYKVLFSVWRHRCNSFSFSFATLRLEQIDGEVDSGEMGGEVSQYFGFEKWGEMKKKKKERGERIGVKRGEEAWVEMDGWKGQLEEKGLETGE